MVELPVSTAQASPLCQISAITIEFLNAMIVGVGDIDISGRICCYSNRVLQLTIPTTTITPLKQVVSGSQQVGSEGKVRAVSGRSILNDGDGSCLSFVGTNIAATALRAANVPLIGSCSAVASGNGVKGWTVVSQRVGRCGATVVLQHDIQNIS
jgi:hypothetical protein